VFHSESELDLCEKNKQIDWPRQQALPNQNQSYKNNNRKGEVVRNSFHFTIDRVCAFHYTYDAFVERENESPLHYKARFVVWVYQTLASVVPDSLVCRVDDEHE
jgi:hypothetical protein